MLRQHRVDSESGILFVTRSGHITTHDEEMALMERIEDSLVVPDIPVPADCREVSPPDSTEVVQYLAKRVTDLATELRCGPVAIIVGSDVEYGRARRYIALTDLTHPDTAVFRDYDEGLQ